MRNGTKQRKRIWISTRWNDMAWFSTDDGRHINTDWLSPEDQLKYKQILANKQIANQLNGITQTSGKQDLFQAPKSNASHNYNKRVTDGADEPEYERSPKMDFLDKRIAGKQKEIEKAQKKLARIKEAQASGWQKNPYYTERDIDSTEREIARLQRDLDDYNNSLQTEISKAKSRNVPAITNFLNDWKEKSIEYYLDQKQRYKEAYEVYKQKDREYTEWLNHPKMFVPDYDRSNPEHKELYSQKWKESREYSQQFKDTWRHVMQFNDGSGTWEENMRKAVEQERIRKYDDIIQRTNDLIGTITDAGGLEVGGKGDLNGIIKGEKGAVRLETIGAGGYNIQRFHFRTLINEVDVEKYNEWKKLQDKLNNKTPEPKKTNPISNDSPAFKTMSRLSKKGISTSWEIENWLRGLSPQRRNRLAQELGITNVRGEDKLKMMVSKIFAAGKDQ